MSEAHVDFLTRHFGVNYDDVIAVDTQLPDKGRALFPKLDRDEFKAIVNGAKENTTASEWDAAKAAQYEIVALWVNTLGEGLGGLIGDEEGVKDKLNAAMEKAMSALMGDEKERKLFAKEESEKTKAKAEEEDRLRNYALLLALPRHSVPAKIRESLGLEV